MNNFDITGKQFGYLTVIERDYSATDKRNSKWICKCKCGNVTSVCRSSLTSGHTMSCGCKTRESKNTTHGLSKSRLYRIWGKMKIRCSSDDGAVRKHYKEKGISVCDEWKSDFMAFYEWSMKNGYKDDLTIDRIDNSKGYCPENCRWATREEQARNQTKNIYVTYNGKDYVLSELCEIIGFPKSTAYRRYDRLRKKGLPITADYLFSPINKSKVSKRYRKD